MTMTSYKNSQSNSWARWPFLGVATAGLFLGAIPALKARTDNVSNTTPASTRTAGARNQDTADSNRANAAGRFGQSFAPVVKQVLPAVVKVYSSSKAQEMPPEAVDPMLRRFFGDSFPGARRSPRQQGIGSGVVVTEDGYILTNNHVVDGADSVKVQLNDGTEHTAKIVGRDPQTDLAVLKIKASSLPHLDFANSDQAEVGDLVLAVGNPFGLGETVTTGIISAKGRASLGLDYEDFIQTDAAINPGNSGGALVDTQGRLLGINTAILSRTGGNQGIGFAIPTNLARDVMDSLIKDGKVARGQLGVRIQDVTPAMAKRLELGESRGAIVGEVSPKSPAAKAGIQSGDVVVEFDGKPVRDSRQLRLAVGRTKPGSAVPVKVVRDGDSKTFKVTIRELASDEVAKDGTGRGSDKDTGTLNGVGVTDISAAQRRQFGVPSSIEGALVTEVEPDSAAYEAGLRPGDVILEINKERIQDAEQAVRLTENPADKTTLLKVWSRGGTRFLVVDETGG
jgi:serine protease Do